MNDLLLELNVLITNHLLYLLSKHKTAAERINQLDVWDESTLCYGDFLHLEPALAGQEGFSIAMLRVETSQFFAYLATVAIDPLLKAELIAVTNAGV